MRPLRVLVTACGAPGTAALVRALRENGEREVWVAGCDMNERAVGRRLCDAFQRVPPGDSPFFAENVLISEGRVVPVDWEAAASGAGEIDVASLLLDWDEQSSEAMVDAYLTARWPASAPPGFSDRLLAAQLYVAFRWLGEWPEWTRDPEYRPQFDRLHELGRRLPAGAQHRRVGRGQHGEDDERDQGDHEQQENDPDEAADDVGGHLLSLVAG